MPGSNVVGGTATTLVDLLGFRAAEAPERRTFTFQPDDAESAVSWTDAELERRARAIGATLQAAGAAGERVLLLDVPGLDFIASLFGCLYAGAIAVPAYPPDPTRPERTRATLLRVVADAAPRYALGPAWIQSQIEALGQAQDSGMRWLSPGDVPDEAALDWRSPELTAGSAAVLQYTSGSTGDPKGVLFSHGNLLHNSSLINGSFQSRPETRGVIWLPPYHDMGLIGGIIQPVYYGGPVLLMSPLAFLQRPVRWLEAISRTRATHSGGPNFAYELCVRKVSEEQRRSLDLRSWQLAFCGSEPIRVDTMERFARTFAPCGFRWNAFFACYGLAEATLIVTGGSPAAQPVVCHVDGDALERHEVVPRDSESPGSRALVGCGHSLPGQQVIIVDPETGRRCPEGRVGEIWVAGGSVAQGYWQRDDETEATFRARLADTDEGPFLRTGDLGFLRGQELFVTGRLKDVIIVRGRNHYPQDIERTVETCDPAFRPGCGAAFAVPGGATERLVVVQEVDPGRTPDPRGWPRDVIRELADQHSLRAHAIVLVQRGTIPKTTSGKVRRRACRDLYLADCLDVVARWPPPTASA